MEICLAKILTSEQVRDLMANYLITVSGIDGSGKSTVIDLLKEHFWSCEIMHILRFRFINRILQKKEDEVNSLSAPIKKKGIKIKQSLCSKNIMPFLNSFLMLIDIISFRHWLQYRKSVVICDRYFFDLIISQQYRTETVPFEKLILKLLKKPDLAIYIYVDPEIAAKRETSDSHSAVYFNTKQKLYELRHRAFNMWKITSTNKTQQQTCNEILNKIKESGVDVH